MYWKIIVYHIICDDSFYPILSFDETKTLEDLQKLLRTIFYIETDLEEITERFNNLESEIHDKRRKPLLPHSLFNDYTSEHKIVRYLQKLQKKCLARRLLGTATAIDFRLLSSAQRLFSRNTI